jgi:ubiquinone/menaquinone biosynthesis C-methylase UbiE
MKSPFLVHLAELGATNLHPLGQQATDCLIAALDPLPGERLLEVGCGTGQTMARLILQTGAHVDGVDVLPEMLRMARRRLRLTGAGSGAALALASGSALPWAGQSFHAAYTESVLGFQDAATARSMLGEIRRVLQPGGRFVANEAVWKRGTDPAVGAAIHAAAVADFGLSQASPQLWSVDDWVRVMKEAGFRLQAADLLAERAATGTEPPPRQLQLSALLTHLYRLRAFLVPRLARQRRHYHRQLARHRQDGLHLESRLFVLDSP